MSGHSPRTMLVTGGAGFIGSNFIRHELRADPEVRVICLDKLTYAGSLDHLGGLPEAPRCRFVQGDVCEASLVRRLIADNDVDTVVHLAAETHVDRSITDPGAFVRTNVVGTSALLEAARLAWLDPPSDGQRRRRLHHVSTDEVYGALGAGAPAFTEASAYAPSSPYAASKAGSDHLVRAYHRTFGLPVVISNSSNNYGPRQNHEKLIPTVIEACRRRAPIPIYGDGSHRRDWLYVEDHCRALDAVLRSGRTGETYNVGAGEELANLDLARRICAIFDQMRPQDAPHDRLIAFVPDRPGHDWRYAVDSAKLTRELGWRPQESLETGLRNTIEWFLACPARPRPAER
ncbi:MAG: dTDP-glucose 4,6-dehydratase [Geminicoccaceae bacterium]